MIKTDTITVLIVDDIPETHENLKKLLYFEKDIKVVGTATNGAQGIEQAKRLNPDVILMDINMPGMDGIAATEAIIATGVNSQIIMMSIQGETDYLRRSMLAGAREFLIKPFSSEELANSIRRVRELQIEYVPRQMEPRSNGHSSPTTAPIEKGKVIAIFSPKGGVGRTTIISNLAVALRDLTQKRVALVDCNLQFGDIAVLFNFQPQKTIADLLPHLAYLDNELLDEVLMKHSSGVRLLLAPPRPEMAELVTGEALSTIINKLRENYDYVLIDTWASFQDQMLSVLDMADRILVTLTLELPALKNVRLFLEVTDSLGYPKSKMTLVMNRADSTGGIRISDVEANLKHPVPVSIVSDGRLVTQALNQGIPFVTLDRNSTVSKCIFSLARLVVDLESRKAEQVNGASRQKNGSAQKVGLSKLGGLSFRRS